MAYTSGEVLTAASLNAFRTTTLGVGTTTPITALEINSDDDLTSFTGTGRGSVTITNSDYASGDHNAIDFCYSPDVPPSARIAAQMTGSGSLLKFGTTNSYGSGVTNTALTIDPAGNIGIGKTAPESMLHLAPGTDLTPNANGVGHIMIDGNGWTSFFTMDGTGTWVGGNSASRAMYLATDETARLTVTGSGDVGIGTTSPSGLCQIGDGSTSGAFRVHANAGSESFRVVTSVVRAKNIVDTTTATAANVFINSANNTMYRSTSSIKYKSPVEDLDDAYADRVLEMRPVWYRSITGNDPTEHSYYGLIAEEVAAIDPRLVTFGPLADCVCADDPDDPGVTVHTPECSTEPEGVQYDRLIPHLISVAQRQAAQIGQLLSRVTALEAA